VIAVKFLTPGRLVNTAIAVDTMYVLYKMVWEKQLAKRAETANLPSISSGYELPNKWQHNKVSSILFVGGGGLGDRIQMTPMLRRVAEVAGCPVDVCASRDCLEWRGLPYVGNVGEDIPTKAWVEQYEAAFTLEGVISDTEAQTCPTCKRTGTELQDLFANHVGVDIPPKSKPDYVILPGEERLVYLPPKEGPRIGVHFGKAAPARVWPREHFDVLINNLLDCGFQVVLFGNNAEAPRFAVEVMGRHYFSPPPKLNLIDYCGQTPTIRSLAVAMKTCDIFVGTDSAPLHLAGTLDIPTVGLYGMFRYEMRGANLPSIRPVQVDWPEEQCKWCYTHVQYGEPLPCGRPFCLMMENIAPETVIAEVDKLLVELDYQPPELLAEIPMSAVDTLHKAAGVNNDSS